MAQLTIDLTTLSNFNTTPNGYFTLKCVAKGVGVNTPSNPSTGVSYTKGILTLSGSLTNGTVTLSVASIRYGGNATATLSTQYPYVLPDSITVTGVTSYTYDQSTGAVTLTGIVDNVVISGACVNLLLSSATISVSGDTLTINDEDANTTNYDIYEIVSGSEVFVGNVNRVGVSAS